jgi:heavy metal sensor kinase
VTKSDPTRPRPGVVAGLVRGLRFRLAASFLLFFTVLLLGLGLVVRQMLITIERSQVSALLDEEWAASKGYLRIENQRAVWYADRFDPEEALIVNRIQGGVYLFADARAKVVDRSEAASTLGLDSTAEVTRLIEAARLKPQQTSTDVRTSAAGETFMLRFGLMPDKDQRQYLLVIGRSLSEGLGIVRKFTLRYFAVIPLLILLCATLGWLVAGRGLAPVTEVAQAAQRITGSNLNVRIPPRRAGDELDHLIEAFNLMIERLDRSFAQIRQFSTDVSHELRTPLTAIRGQLEVALFTAERPEQFRDAMVNALQDVEQLSNIVRALLLLSQAESGQLALQMAPVNLAAVVRDLVEQFQIPAEEAGISLSVKAPGELTIRADQTQMGRLVSNLLSNAIKYTRSGGSVRVALRGEEDQVALTVEDTGIGIPAENLPHIFNRFYRVRPAQSHPVPGLGLGLSFVAWIVNVHGGRIEVDSQEGKGTRFIVHLPRSAERAARPEPSLAPTPYPASLP